MYVGTPSKETWFPCGVYEWDRPPNGGHKPRRPGTRHFLAAADGRVEEVNDAERAAGLLPRLEIEQRR